MRTTLPRAWNDGVLSLERPSFMSLNKILPSSSSQATVGPWRRSTLRLSEQPSEERASTTYLLQIQEVRPLLPSFRTPREKKPPILIFPRFIFRLVC